MRDLGWARVSLGWSPLIDGRGPESCLGPSQAPAPAPVTRHQSVRTQTETGAQTRGCEMREWRYHVSKAADFLANSCDICLSTLH